MLVLSREVDQKIVIGDDIVITLVDVRGGARPKVRIGIEAPKHIRVHRQEVLEAMQASGNVRSLGSHDE